MFEGIVRSYGICINATSPVQIDRTCMLLRVSGCGFTRLTFSHLMAFSFNCNLATELHTVPNSGLVLLMEFALLIF